MLRDVFLPFFIYELFVYCARNTAGVLVYIWGVLLWTALTVQKTFRIELGFLMGYDYIAISGGRSPNYYYLNV